MEKKYELIKEGGYTRIRALKDFQLITGEIVRKGDLGGCVHGAHNLSQEGNCWISYYAKVCQNSRIKDNAVIKDRSRAKNNAVMKDCSIAYDNSTISGNAVMKDCSRAEDNSIISGNAVMKDNSIAYDNSTICGNTVLKDWSEVHGNSTISENAVLQAYQHIQFGTVTTDLLGTKDWVGALYAELGIVPNDNKIVLYKRVWSTDDESVFKSDYDRNLLYKIGKISRVRKVDEDIFKSCTRGLHFTSLEFVNRHKGNTILECEVDVDDIVTVQDGKVRARKCKVLRVYKGE